MASSSLSSSVEPFSAVPDHADKLVVLTNAHTDGTDDTSVINIDKCKMIDLIYFNKKYKNDDIIDTDSDRVLMLAKSVLIC